MRGLLLVLLTAPAVAAERPTSCHIHPPGSTPQRPAGTIGPYASPAACERERFARFGALGRCHCAADFSPRWLPPPDLTRPGESPLG